MYDMYEKKPTIKHYVIVDNIKKLRKLAAQLENLEEWAFDTETNTLKVYGYNKDFKCVGISISWGDYNNYYIPLGHIREEDWDRQLSLEQVVRYLRRPFEREDVRLIGNNIKFDMHVMARIGINIKTQDLYDTMIASWLCDENSPNGLKENSMKKLDVQQEHFGEVTKTVTSDIKKQYGLKASNKATFDMVLIDDAAPYALDDAFYTWCLYVGSMDELEEEGMTKIFNKTYVKFIRTLFNMEERGVQVDFEHLKQMEHDVAEDKEKLLYGVYELAGCEFNVNSNAQLVELLFGYQKPIADPRDSSTFRKLTEKEQQKKIKDYDKKIATAAESVTLKYSFNFKPISKTASGAPQVNARTLIKLSKQSFKAKRKNEGVELCKLLLQYKKLEKLSTAFLDGLEVQLYDDGKAHPSFNIIGTDSGRLSCSAPNLQQLPKADEEDKYQIRSLFVGSEFVALEDGEWVSDDLSDCIDDCHIERKKIIAGDYNNLEMRVLAHYCVQRNMPITLADSNSSMEIGRIVQKCDPVSVKAYNFDTGKVESKKVTNFWKNGQSNLYDKPPYRGSFKDWLRITVDWGNDRLVVTPNHEIYTLNGKVPASNLKVGDTLFYNCPCIENDLVDLIVGMSLGDSNFRKETDSMVFYHTEAQKDYFMWKRELLSNFISPHIQKSGDISKSVIGAHPFIHELKEHFKFAKRKHKCVKESLADLVTIKSLAIWYLDDGCISHDDRCSEEKGYTACICRENIGDGFIARLNEKFAGHGFTFNHILKGLTCSGEKAINFYKAIAPYCPKCMSYKFPFFLRDLVGIYTWNTEHRDVTEVKIQSIEPVKLGDPLFKKSLTQSGYDLEVEDLHNYFANNILVSNSKDHNLLEMFETGSDTHSSTAVNMFELDCDISEVKKKYPHLRQAAKVINFLDQTLKTA